MYNIRGLCCMLGMLDTCCCGWGACDGIMALAASATLLQQQVSAASCRPEHGSSSSSWTRQKTGALRVRFACRSFRQLGWSMLSWHSEHGAGGRCCSAPSMAATPLATLALRGWHSMMTWRGPLQRFQGQDTRCEGM